MLKFVNFFNSDDILEINISPGKEKPYYLKAKDPKSSGVYIKYGRNKCQASRNEILRLIMKSNTTPYEMLPSLDQDLKFNVLKLKLEEKGISFNQFKMIISGFVKNNEYTNLAYIFSDQYKMEKIGVYSDIDRSILKTIQSFNGSVINQID